MFRSNRQFLAYLMVAVTVLAGGLNGYLALSGHDEAVSVEHVLGGATSSHDHEHSHATAIARYSNVEVNDHAGCHDHGCDNSDHGDHAWQHVHAHCCGSSALVPGYAGLERFGISRDVEFALNAALPSGKLSFPLLRPPRSIG